MKTYLGLALAAATLLAAPVLACDEAKAQKRAEARSAALAEADADGDGALSTQEFAVFEDTFRRDRTAAHFAYIDADGNGLVTAEELQNARPKRHHKN
jgi:hypothetical protein